ncbi:MAG: hypothetical protein MUC49_14505 [Raineya sp.]|jgi:hypothetical protein|nr:hypothetical protein [Raineya sp.]
MLSKGKIKLSDYDVPFVDFCMLYPKLTSIKYNLEYTTLSVFYTSLKYYDLHNNNVVKVKSSIYSGLYPIWEAYSNQELLEYIQNKNLLNDFMSKSFKNIDFNYLDWIDNLNTKEEPNKTVIEKKGIMIFEALLQGLHQFNLAKLGMSNIRNLQSIDIIPLNLNEICDLFSEEIYPFVLSSSFDSITFKEELNDFLRLKDVSNTKYYFYTRSISEAYYDRGIYIFDAFFDIVIYLLFQNDQ